MITELYVPRAALGAFLSAVRADFRQHGVQVIYGTIRLIERDTESFLAWAREPWVCTVMNLHVDHTPERHRARRPSTSAASSIAPSQHRRQLFPHLSSLGGARAGRGLLSANGGIPASEKTPRSGRNIPERLVPPPQGPVRFLVPNAKFAQSCREFDCELWVQRDTRTIELHCPFDSEVRVGRAAGMANFGIGTLAGWHRTHILPDNEYGMDRGLLRKVVIASAAWVTCITLLGYVVYSAKCRAASSTSIRCATTSSRGRRGGRPKPCRSMT